MENNCQSGAHQGQGQACVTEIEPYAVVEANKLDLQLQTKQNNNRERRERGREEEAFFNLPIWALVIYLSFI